MQNLPPELREYYNDKINFKGRALSDQSFNFDTDRRASGHIYLLTENG